jgi:hypothetical protein
MGRILSKEISYPRKCIKKTDSAKHIIIGSLTNKLVEALSSVGSIAEAALQPLTTTPLQLLIVSPGKSEQPMNIPSQKL